MEFNWCRDCGLPIVTESEAAARPYLPWCECATFPMITQKDLDDDEEADD